MGVHLGMACLASLRIGFTSWRTMPLLFSSCLALIGALDRDAQQPFCYASDGKRAVFPGPFGGLPHVSSKFIKSWKLRTHNGGNTLRLQATRAGLRHLLLNPVECG